MKRKKKIFGIGAIAILLGLTMLPLSEAQCIEQSDINREKKVVNPLDMEAPLINLSVKPININIIRIKLIIYNPNPFTIWVSDPAIGNDCGRTLNLYLTNPDGERIGVTCISDSRSAITAKPIRGKKTLIRWFDLAKFEPGGYLYRLYNVDNRSEKYYYIRDNPGKYTILAKYISFGGFNAKGPVWKGAITTPEYNFDYKVIKSYEQVRSINNINQWSNKIIKNLFPFSLFLNLKLNFVEQASIKKISRDRLHR